MKKTLRWRTSFHNVKFWNNSTGNAGSVETHGHQTQNSNFSIIHSRAPQAEPEDTRQIKQWLGSDTTAVPHATGTSIKQWASQENVTYLHHGRTCSNAGNSSVTLHATLNTSVNSEVKIHYWSICHWCYVELKLWTSAFSLTDQKQRGLKKVSFILGHFACRYITWNFLPSLIQTSTNMNITF